MGSIGGTVTGRRLSQVLMFLIGLGLVLGTFDLHAPPREHSILGPADPVSAEARHAHHAAHFEASEIHLPSLCTNCVLQSHRHGEVRELPGCRAQPAPNGRLAPGRSTANGSPAPSLVPARAPPLA